MESIYSINLPDLILSRKKGKKSILQDYYNKNIIYCWEINNKFYIGLTTNLRVRIKNYLSNASKDHYISRAINKYKNDSNSLFYILEICDSVNDLYAKEKYFIKKYNTIDDGYNLTSGGEFTKASNDTINKMIKAASNKKKTFYFNTDNELIYIFDSVRSSARFLNKNSTSIFAAIKNKTLLYNKYYISYNENEIFTKKQHSNKKIMVNNRNGTRYIWKIIFDNGITKEEDSLLLLFNHVENIKFSTFRRIAENKMKNNLHNFKIIKYNK